MNKADVMDPKTRRIQKGLDFLHKRLTEHDYNRNHERHFQFKIASIHIVRNENRKRSVALLLFNDRGRPYVRVVAPYNTPNLALIRSLRWMFKYQNDIEFRRAVQQIDKNPIDRWEEENLIRAHYFISLMGELI